jgi:hypothetical protein
MQVDNAEGLSLISSNPGVAVPQPALFKQAGPVRITRQNQKFRIFAGVNGDAEIRAVDAAGRIHARLAVSVLSRLTVKCVFHFVQNPRYGTRTRKRGDETAFVSGLNDIWGPQANIFFEQISGGGDLKMTENLGDSIDTDAKFDTVTNHRNRAAQFNVFFVRDVEKNPNKGDSDDALTFVGPPGDCVFEDDSGDGDPGMLISHEAGHCLTIDHNDPIPATNDMLMNHFVTHTFLPKVHVLRARRAVRR